MRYEAVGPDVAVLDLLARANDLAAAAVVAIEHGDDEALNDLLDQRGRVVDAATAAMTAWSEKSAVAPTAEMVARVAAAAQVSVRIGHQAGTVAKRVRDEVVTELSLLEARQSASKEYQQGSVHSAINVVL